MSGFTDRAKATWVHLKATKLATWLNPYAQKGMLTIKLLGLFCIVFGVGYLIKTEHGACPKPLTEAGLESCRSLHAGTLAVDSITLALVYTFLVTFGQYLMVACQEGNSIRWYSLFLLLLVAAGIGWCVSDLRSECPTLLGLVESRYVNWVFPSRKNVAVALIALLFLTVDAIEPKFRHVLRDDFAVLGSIVLSSMLIGILGAELLGKHFIEAYNVGTVSFHLILGTIIFDPLRG